MLRSPLTSRIAGPALLAVAGMVGVVLAARSGHAVSAILAGVALACGLVLVARMDRADGEEARFGQVFDVALVVLPAALVVYLSFHSGGYFPTAPAVAALLVIVVLLL